jgi:predicted RNA-binding protein YlxR (DUF448 family)
LGLRHAERHCIATGNVMPAAAMVRFVRAPSGDVVPDIAGDLPGRGVWVTATKALVDTAVKKRAFARGLKPENDGLTVADNLSGTVEQLLAKRCLDLLGLARRSGALVAGMEKVAALAKANKIAVLIAARDGAADGREKLKRLSPGIPVVELFSSGELGLALGRENVIHAALTSDSFAERFITEVRRLEGFRSLEGRLVDE